MKGIYLLLTAILLAAGVFAKKKSAYHLVYFKDDTHWLYMALSNDGYSFTDVNNAKPIMAGDTVMKATNFSSPKHDAVLHLSAKEAKQLAKHRGLQMNF